MVTKEDIEKLAALARIRLSEGEAEKLRGDVEAILGYVSQVQGISGETAPLGKSDLAVSTVMRGDGEPHESGIYTEMLVSSAPRREGGYIKVKKIL